MQLGAATQPPSSAAPAAPRPRADAQAAPFPAPTAPAVAPPPASEGPAGPPDAGGVAEALAPPSEVASAKGIGRAIGDVLSAVIPDAFVIGETHSRLEGLPGILNGGNFFLANPFAGTYTYFGTKPVPGIKLPPIGPFQPSVSIVGTVNARTGEQESGLGLTGVLNTPIGGVALFVNGRGGDGARIDDILRSGDGSGTFSVNFGFIMNESAVMTAGGALLGFPGAGYSLNAVMTAVGARGWVGAAYRTTATFDEGRLVSLKIGDVEIPADRLADLFGGAEPQPTARSAADIAVGGVLYQAFVAGGASVTDAAAWTQDTYDNGGAAAVTAKAKRTLAGSLPRNRDGDVAITGGGFRSRGMGAEAAPEAMRAYAALRAADPPAGIGEAWATVWSVYLEGAPGAGGAAGGGMRAGGNAGGLAAIRAYADRLAP